MTRARSARYSAIPGASPMISAPMSRPLTAKIARLGAGSTHDAAAKGELAPSVSGPSSPETLSAMLVDVAYAEQVADLNAARKAASIAWSAPATSRAESAAAFKAEEDKVLDERGRCLQQIADDDKRAAERQALIDAMPKPVSKYTEGFLVGYRWFDTKEIKPMYAFGHGLSYVTFGYGEMKATASEKSVKVSFDLTNEGQMAADEVVQLYVHRVDSQVEWPAKELKAFARVSLKAGQKKTVTLEIPLKDLRYWNVDTDAWDLEHGKLQLLLGAASDDIRQQAEVEI